MILQFATCERARALDFIRRVYPTRTVDDSPECAGPVLDLVERDIVRIQDPLMYGPTIQVVPGVHWDESNRDAVASVCKRFVSSLTRAKT